MVDLNWRYDEYTGCVEAQTVLGTYRIDDAGSGHRELRLIFLGPATEEEAGSGVTLLARLAGRAESELHAIADAHFRELLKTEGDDHD